jgi:hypothetical protein
MSKSKSMTDAPAELPEWVRPFYEPLFKAIEEDDAMKKAQKKQKAKIIPFPKAGRPHKGKN